MLSYADSTAWDTIQAVERRELQLFGTDTGTTTWHSFLTAPKNPTPTPAPGTTLTPKQREIGTRAAHLLAGAEAAWPA